MNRVFKTLLLWLLILALPAQGFAAMTKMVCEPSHHVAGAIAVDEHAMHDHVVQSASGIDKSAGHGSSMHKGKLDINQCSSCSFCCVGASMSPAALNWNMAHYGTPHLFPASALPFSGYVPDGPERPPRSRLI